MSKTSDVVLEMSVEYLGPAAITLLERQTKFHLNGLNFSDIGPEHCIELAKWVALASSMFIEQDLAQELADKIGRLA
ncbi:hypothetical protein KHC33_06520 [Methanospirillum sp. J.3.6.1-F.2.7.3]|uniref:Uncharacterized protein n=1 Tax=Methanospirillum purgamenti TaxID=2834276 RepID=A0A8E7B491_9EURY|nr:MULTISPECIES: hypothetical protein [Methanospirillum]MDX8550013.1 hypothetical protein [Methanospirillum hungatei]QVV90141.1 hypothetical protein KHC33_06520 [Methanospirillum sp. J.3.6.1-F.2.7.3]